MKQACSLMPGGFQGFSFSLLLQGLIRNNLLLFSLLVAVPLSVQAEEAASSDLGAAISVVSGGGANIGGDANTVEGVEKVLEALGMVMGLVMEQGRV